MTTRIQHRISIKCEKGMKQVTHSVLHHLWWDTRYP